MGKCCDSATQHSLSTASQEKPWPENHMTSKAGFHPTPNVTYELSDPATSDTQKSGLSEMLPSGTTGTHSQRHFWTGGWKEWL